MADDAKRVALVSGGSRGIGRAVVKRLAAEGHDISFCYQSNGDAAMSLEKELDEFGVRVLSRQVDVASADSVRAWVGETQETLGAVDVAVTAAGITRDSPLLMMTDEQWR
ncbi:SDR family NAD(P)-dependent oxidoreductase, partial [Streptomyces anulatus]